MAELFANGRIVDVALALVALEALALLAWRWRRKRGPSPSALLANLASGAALMLAVRAALTGAGWPVVAGCLLAALVAHLADLVLRLRAHDSAIDPPRSHPWALGRRQTASEQGTSTEIAAFPARRYLE